MQQEQLLMCEWLDSLMLETWGAKAVTLQHKGQAWMCATNGRALVLVAGAGSVAAPPDRARAVANLLEYDRSRGRKSHSIPLATLRAWLPSDPAELPCPVCKGGELKEFKCKTCGGDGFTECHHCGSETDCRECGGAKKSFQCEECEGDGTIEAQPSWAPIAHGATGPVINRHLAQRFIGPLLRGEQVEVRHGDKLDQVTFHGDGWLVIVMPHGPGEPDPDDGPLGPALLADPVREVCA